MKRTSNELSKRHEVDSIEKQIDERVQNYCQEIDRTYTERLCERYRDLVPAHRIEAVKDLPTRFEDRKKFEQSYREATGGEEAENVVGFSRGTLEPAQVESEHDQIRKTTIHERLHQLADPRAEQLLGTKMNEGITEDLAIRELGSEWDPELPRSYTKERALASKVRELCGDQAVEQAYFRGDTRELKVCLDRQLGKNNLERLQDLEDDPAQLAAEQLE